MSFTAVPWPVPVSWTWLPAGKVGEVSLGRQRSPENHVGPHMRAYLRSANITWDGWDLSDVKAMNFDERDFGTFGLHEGDVLLNEGSGSAGEVGKPAVWQGQIQNCCFQNTLLRFRSPHVDPWYARAFFSYSARAGHLVKHTQGVNIIHIGKRGLEELSVPVAPIAEQRRIVAKIDRLSARSKRARDELERVRSLHERGKQGIIDFHIENATLYSPQLPMTGCLVTAFDGPFGSNLKSSDYTDEGVRVVRLENIKKGWFEDSKKTYVSEEKYLNLTRHTLRQGDLMVASFIDEEIRACMLPNLDALAINKADCFCLRIDASVCSPAYLLHVLNSSNSFEKLAGHVHGATRARISLSQLKQLTITMPSLEEQTTIVRRIEHAFAAIDRLAAGAQSARALLDKLDQAILAKAFRGELVPQDPDDEPASVLLDRIRSERAAAPAKQRGRRTRVA